MRPAPQLLLAVMLGVALASCLEIHRKPATEDVTVDTIGAADAPDDSAEGSAADGDAPCVPDCAGRECGANGCGGSCGTCPIVAPACTEEGLCCVPACGAQQCGPDGCDGTCGVCEYPLQCLGGSCVCVPNCDGKDCGPNGCGGVCGTCDLPLTCIEGTCACKPACAGKTCGDDGCGGLCGMCPAAKPVCDAGTCVCAPECAGKTCGDDGCGGTCGTCPAAKPTCQAGVCVAGPCVADCVGKECGSDGCGGSCGTCPAGHGCMGWACVKACGDGLCADGESCNTCQADCGTCAPPLLTAFNHAGWKKADCVACHGFIESHDPGLAAYECVACHGTNGAPVRLSGHPGLEDSCTMCHAAPHDGAGFPEPAACLVCHPKQE